jgi:sugar phosphate isomerase/epimerase
MADPLHISLCNEVLGDMPFERQCAFAAALGYDGLEVAPFTLGAEAWNLPLPRRVALRRAAADAGIAVSGLHALLWEPKGLSITTSDEALRRRTIDIMRRLIGLAADLGARTMVHGSPLARLIDGPDSERRGIESFAAIAPDAESAGVIYCLEPLVKTESIMIRNLREAFAVVDAIGSPAIRTMIDAAAAAMGEDGSVADTIRRVMPSGKIAHVHFSAPNRLGPADGDLDFAPIVAALTETRYGGGSAVEPFVFLPDGPACAARQIGYLRGLQSAIAFSRSPN